MDNPEKNRKYEKPRISTIQDLSLAFGACATGTLAFLAGEPCSTGIHAGITRGSPACSYGTTAQADYAAGCANGGNATKGYVSGTYLDGCATGTDPHIQIF